MAQYVPLGVRTRDSLRLKHLIHEVSFPASTGLSDSQSIEEGGPFDTSPAFQLFASACRDCLRVGNQSPDRQHQ